MNSSSSFKTIDEYISLYPKEIQKLLQEIRKVIHAEVPNGVETIAYQMPTIKLHGKNLVHFAAFKAHVGFFPTPHPIEVFKEDLKQYKTSKGTIQFQYQESLPLDLIRKIVKQRVVEVTSQAK